MAADGTIAFAEGYEGPHALFILPLDAGRADPDAVEKFIADSWSRSCCQPDSPLPDTSPARVTR